MKKKLSATLKYLLERAREPSTWAAASTLGAILHFDPSFLAQVTQIGSAAPVVAGLLLGVFLPEKGAYSAEQEQ